MPVDQSLECLPCHQTDWRTEPPEASLPSKWLPSTDGELDPQEPPTCPPLFHPNSRADQPPKFLHLPYVRGVSERIERNCRRLGIRTTFKLKGILTEPSLNVAPADCLYIITLLALNLANMLDLAFKQES